LRVNNNSISRLAYGMHKLHALKIFTLSSNQLVWLPNPLSRLRGLETFDYEDNPLDKSYSPHVHNAGVLLDYIGAQRVPQIYYDDALQERKSYKEKMAKLSTSAKHLQNLLKYKEGMEALEEFTGKEHNAENLHFYKSVRHFRKKFRSTQEITHESLIQEARGIFDRFIDDKGDEQVNLPAEATQVCTARFLDTFVYPKGINQWIFDQAYQASFDLMMRDTFQRFSQTQTGKELIELLERTEKAKELKIQAQIKGKASSSASKEGGVSSEDTKSKKK